MLTIKSSTRTGDDMILRPSKYNRNDSVSRARKILKQRKLQAKHLQGRIDVAVDARKIVRTLLDKIQVIASDIVLVEGNTEDFLEKDEETYTANGQKLHKHICSIKKKEISGKKKFEMVANLIMRAMDKMKDLRSKEMEDLNKLKADVIEFVNTTLDEAGKFQIDDYGNISTPKPQQEQLKLDTNLFRLFKYEDVKPQHVFKRKKKKD